MIYMISTNTYFLVIISDVITYICYDSIFNKPWHSLVCGPFVFIMKILSVSHFFSINYKTIHMDLLVCFVMNKTDF